MSRKSGVWWRRLRRVPLFIGGGYLVWSAKPNPMGTIVGLILIGLGEAWRIWGTGHLQKNEELTVTGPYAYVKNPLYVGSILIAVGFCILADTVYFLALITLMFCFHYIPYKKKMEGDRLRRIFGAQYEDYDEKVPDYLPRWTPYSNRKAPWSFKSFWENSEVGVIVSILFGVVLILTQSMWRALL
jgi:protein-S-isoprenylcysteine O-methyltransferase Ste14